MNYRFSELTKKTMMSFCVAALCGGFAACTDDYDLDDPGNYPSWLGNSIFDELKNPNQNVLTGTFNNYVKLIEDLGYAETLAKTGSKTVFPANDEAFARFFSNNSWGVSRYEDLTEAQKKLLLYNSMLDNAILVELLSNVSEGSTSVASGIAMKHQTGANVIDSVSYFYGATDLPKNNKYWDWYNSHGINLVMDGTRPMMVHFTAEQMTANDISTTGANSDFAIITGEEYNDSAATAYIFRDRIIRPDVTCQNGYIHQMQDVIVPPGNMAELLRTNPTTTIFSRMLERFSAPYYSLSVTNNYNDWAVANGKPTIDSIFQKRYLSSYSQGGTLRDDPNGTTLSTDYVLPYDPGWNAYYTQGTNSNLSDVAAMFVPSDEAMKKYFLPGGEGAFLIKRFGSFSNDEEHLMQNIDSIPQDIVCAFVSMLMKSSFIAAVPSKFDNVPDDSNDPMGLTIDEISKTEDGKYDVKIANNGVIYILNTVHAPNKYVAVSAPALLNKDMRVMNWGIFNKTNRDQNYGLGLNFYAYLLAMDANYGLFIPNDAAFDKYYIDPISLATQPRVLHYFYNSSKSPYIFCSARNFNPATGEISNDSTILTNSQFPVTQFIDILNTHTVVLEDGEEMGANKYYKTKNGGTIYFDKANSTVMGGAQMDNGVAPSRILQVDNQKNGKSYTLDHVIEMPQNSVYKVLSGTQQFSDFFDLCNDDRADSIREFAGISTKTIEGTKISPMTRFYTFRTGVTGYYGLDFNVNYFSSYNYTVYAPDNSAMEIARQKGLPTWDDLYAIFKQHVDSEDGDPAKIQAQAEVLAKVEAINDFIRYHFQNNSVYVDNTVGSGEYMTAASDTLGIAYKVNVVGGGNKFTVIDGSNQSVEVNGNGKLINKMTRDYVFAKSAQDARNLTTNSISTSSFAVVHEIDKPLCKNADGRYDGMWASAKAKKGLVEHRNLFLQRQKEMYRK